MSALRRPALLAGSAIHKEMAFPLRFGVGLQSARMFRPQQLQLFQPSRGLSMSVLIPYTSSGNNRGHSHNSGSSSSSKTPRLWYMAASVPFLVDVSQSPPATSAVSQSTYSNQNNYGLPLNAEVASEMSKGSVLGFLIGLLVSTFSKTLVLLVGVAIAGQSLAARAGIDLVRYFHLKEKFNKNRLLKFLSSHTYFKLAFGVTFALSAFMAF
ncbi:hypothetical protein SEUCBS139899_000570 [Sporothrix eucalyptigena]|uniref:Fun14 family protein n=1 Tax=Sporothrix eucalyptigena TaxID=1812306 RepID=A0ABP0BFB3_9PEZI